MNRVPDNFACPCGRPVPYAACCGISHAGNPAADVESLMRSRYSAFVLGLEDYLLATWQAATRPTAINLTTQPTTKWLGLEIKGTTLTGTDSATVEFIARHKIGGRAQRLHETSRFVREEDRWYYVEGNLH